MDVKADSYAHCEQIMEEEIDYIAKRDSASKTLRTFRAAGNLTTFELKESLR
jgi:hypothetical protein